MKRLFLIMCSMVIFSSCATVPRESAQLSAELTGMIRTAKATHLALLNQYILQRKERVNDFMERIWIPNFMENTIKDTKVIELVNTAKDDKEKQGILKEFEEDASVQINKRRSTLIDAVDEIKNTLQEAITDHYDQMMIVNQALTSNLQSAADVGELREKLTNALKIDTNKLIPIDKIDDIMNKALTYQSKAEDITNTIEQIKTIIKGK